MAVSKKKVALEAVEIEMPIMDPKKKVVKFEADDEDAAVKNVYVSNETVEKLGGCGAGVKLIVVAL